VGIPYPSYFFSNSSKDPPGKIDNIIQKEVDKSVLLNPMTGVYREWMRIEMSDAFSISQIFLLRALKIPDKQ